MFHEVSMNSYSIDAIFEEDSGTFNQTEITGLNQKFPRGVSAFRNAGQVLKISGQ